MTQSAEKIVLFLGSGFSRELGLPTSSELQDSFLESEFPPGDDLEREAFVSRIPGTFWRDVFGWTASRPRPALEDHFTQIDLAANSGHYLGRCYGPKKLRALRRMTIHRAFRLLDKEPRFPPHVDEMFTRLINALL